MKNINIPIEDERHADLVFLQDYYSKKNGTKISRIQVLKILIFEAANRARHEQKYGNEGKESGNEK
jgi:hypothetical protein